MKLRLSILAAMLAAAPVAAQEAASSAETPRGTYLAYADEAGVAFISYEPALAEENRWPMTFFYYPEGAPSGGARATGTAACETGSVEIAVTNLLAPDGSNLGIPESHTPPTFTFERADGAGDAAVVDFICGDANARLAQSSAPVFGTPVSVARVYIALRRAGLSDRLSRDLAIRDPDSNGPLIDTAVPQERREAVHDIMAGTHPD